MHERDIEAALVERIEALGGETRKVKWIGRVAAPDRVVMLPGKRESGPFDAPPRTADEVRSYATTHGVSHREAADVLKRGSRVVAYPATIWVECKAPGEKPRPSQLREHERMRALGQRVLVIDSLEQIDRHFPLNKLERCDA